MTRLSVHRVGAALLVHEEGRLDRRAVTFARGLAADPHLRTVVVDLPPEAFLLGWPTLGVALQEHADDGVRLVFGRPTRSPAWWRSPRSWPTMLARPVLVADGTVRPVAGGGLFIPVGNGTGWVRCEPVPRPSCASRRYPVPAWDTLVTDDEVRVDADLVATPVAAGIWLRRVGDATLTAETGRRPRISDRRPRPARQARAAGDGRSGVVADPAERRP